MKNTIKQNQNLTELNTLKLKSQASFFIELTDLSELTFIRNYIKDKSCNYFVLGGGSNLIIPERYEGLVIHNRLMGINKIKEESDYVIVECQAGENWDNFVLHTLKNRWFGLENLSLIPGTVGAAPIQNIGAYGAESGEFIEYVRIFDMLDGEFKELSKDECSFSYRNSIFKASLNYIVTAVGFKLLKNSKLNTSYKDIALCMQKILNPTSLDLRDCVIDIRRKKLPDPNFIPNVGSFFQNPIILEEHAYKLKEQYSDLPIYKVSERAVKISAGWLIEKLGLKGYKDGNIGIYEKQALVLVNHGGATMKDILTFARKIKEQVKLAYNIDLVIEPVIKGAIN